MGSLSLSPKSIMSSYFDPQQEPHFLDACSLCSKPLGFNSDIFMYRGNTPFCSKECREEQIEMDEAKEKSWKRAASRSINRQQQQQSSDTTSKTKSVRTAGTVAVA